MASVSHTNRGRLRLASLFLCSSILYGCASTPANTHLVFTKSADEKRLMWPSPPEVPRFMYAGDLTGEANFVSDEATTQSGIVAAFEWLTDLTIGKTPPIVMQRPQAGVVDEQGRIFVTDSSRKAIFVFDKTGERLHAWDRAGEKTFFSDPVGIALGSNGEIFVSDAELGIVVRLAHDGTPLGTLGKGVLKRPTGLARDPKAGLLYVADTRAHDIKVFDDQGRLVNAIGHPGDVAGELNAPTFLSFADDELYVTDSLNSRIQVYSGNGDLLRSFGSRGLYIGNLVRPKGVAVDNEGHIYVVESYYGYLLVYDKDGQLLMSIGGSGTQAGQFYLPAGVWVDRDNRVFVADMFNGRVEVFQFLGEF